MKLAELIGITTNVLKGHQTLLESIHATLITQGEDLNKLSAAVTSLTAAVAALSPAGPPPPPATEPDPEPAEAMDLRALGAQWAPKP